LSVSFFIHTSSVWDPAREPAGQALLFPPRAYRGGGQYAARYDAPVVQVYVQAAWQVLYGGVGTSIPCTVPPPSIAFVTGNESTASESTLSVSFFIRNLQCGFSSRHEGAGPAF
jgi:hypothetical protein